MAGACGPRVIRLPCSPQASRFGSSTKYRWVYGARLKVQVYRADDGFVSRICEVDPQFQGDRAVTRPRRNAGVCPIARLPHRITLTLGQL